MLVTVTSAGLERPEATSAVGWSSDPLCAPGSVIKAIAFPNEQTSVVATSGNDPFVSATGSLTTCVTFGYNAASPGATVWTPQDPSMDLVVASATNASISSITPVLVTASVPPTLTVVGIVPTPTTRLAFVAVGDDCGLPAHRFGGTPVVEAGDVTLNTALDTGAPVVSMTACLSVDDGQTWFAQSASGATIQVTTECSTLTTCAACAGNQFCSFCLPTGACNLNGTVPCGSGDPLDVVAPSEACPEVTLFEPQAGDATGGTVVTLGVDYLTDSNGTDLACRWAVGSAFVETPFSVASGPGVNAVGTCVAPTRIGAAPAAALSLVRGGIAYTSKVQFFIYYDCSGGDGGCGDCVVRAPECGFCMANLRCSTERNCANATAVAPWTKAACPRVTSLEPPSINYRGEVEVVLGGALFLDAGDDLRCGFATSGGSGGGGAGGNLTRFAEATFDSAARVTCVAPAGEAATQVDVDLFVGNVRLTTSPGRLLYEADPAPLVTPPLSTGATVGIIAAVVVACMVAVCCVAWCVGRKRRESYLPPKLSDAQVGLRCCGSCFDVCLVLRQFL